jgi:dolichol-phosphate mannosyltransferase
VLSVSPTTPRVLVCIATYKERENLEPLVREILSVAPQVDILVTDDNSPDGTGEIADRLAQEDPRVHVNHRAGKLGLGTAILAGLRYAMQHNYDRVVSMDADFSHHPRYLPAVIAGLDKYDVMIGSRYIPGGGVVNWPLSRQMMSAAINAYVRLLMRLPARDTSGGFRGYSVAFLRRVNFKNLISRGYSFQQEVLLRCRLAGARIGETPILFEDRRFGTTKVNPWEMIRSIWAITRIGIASLFGNVPR